MTDETINQLTKDLTLAPSRLVYTNTGEEFGTLDNDEEWDFVQLRAFITHDIDSPLNAILHTHYELRTNYLKFNNNVNDYNRNLKQAINSKNFRAKLVTFTEPQLSELLSLIKQLVPKYYAPTIHPDFESTRKAFRHALAQQLKEERKLLSPELQAREKFERKELQAQIRTYLLIAPSQDTTPYSIMSIGQLKAKLKQLKERKEETQIKKAFEKKEHKAQAQGQAPKTKGLLKGLTLLNPLENDDLVLFVD